MEATSTEGKKVVTLLTTGGTIATTRGPDGRTAPTLPPEGLAAVVRGPVIVDARELSREPSWALTPAAMAAIALAARDAAKEPGVDGVVVTHGTTTLEYSAFLADLVLDTATPVVLTGAMRRADDPHPDGPANLRDAIAVATSEAARGKGALVVFAGRVISGHRAWKARREAVDAFFDLGGQLGSVRDGDVTIAGRAGRPQPFSGRLEERVRLVKVVPGDDGRLLDAAVASGARGIVLEALPGSGGIPRSMHPAVAAASRMVPLVVASRAPFGRVADSPTGGTGEPLRELGLLSAGGLTAEQAWLLLMAALGEAGAAGTDPARTRFAAAVAALT